METEKILVPHSLQETLWRLEEVRQGFRSKSLAHVKEALDWILARQGLPESYSSLFMPTKQDLARGARLPTGERMQSDAGTRHVLGEEALRTAIVWKRRASPAVTRAVKGFSDLLERGGKRGHWCCYICTTAFLRTLAVVKLDDWGSVLEKGLSRIEKARTPDGRWRCFPFYYTLLILSEMDSPSAQGELKHASKAAERLLKRYQNTDRTSRFRRLALKAALNSL